MFSSRLSFERRGSVRSIGSGRSGGAIGLALLLLAVSATAATFDEQRKAIAGSINTQPEAVISSLLEAGLAEGKPVLAIAEAQKWLRQNIPQDPMLLYNAGRAAELSGDWKGAVALYQQYLAKADLKSATADEAVYTTYILLIERLNDSGSAYSFSRHDGGRLLVCPRAKQFDKWFLDEAVRRTDATAVAVRLNDCITAGHPADLLVVNYSNYFRWLLSAVDGFIDHGLPVTQELYDAVKDLCEVMTHDEEMKLRLDWAVSVKAYNVAKLGDQAKKKVVRRSAGKIKGINNTIDKKQPKKEPGKKASDAKDAAVQAVEEKKLELGDDVTPPIAESAALLEKYPRYVLWVMTGWAGGGNGPHYRGDPKKYWPHEADAKMAPIMAALPKLTLFEQAEFLSTVGFGNYVNTPGVLDIREVRNYIRANPDLWKLRNGPVILPREWNQLSQEDAQNLAPRIGTMAHPLVSVVRAIAAGGKDYDKVMAALLGPEAWRLGPGELNHVWPDQLWHYCGRPGGSEKRDAEIAKSKALAAAFAAGDAKKEDPADKRIAAFRNLWADYKSAQPKIPYAKPRALAILKFTPELVPELLKDPNPEAQGMVRDAIAAGMEDEKGPLGRDGRVNSVSSSVYDPWFYRMAVVTYGGMDRFKQDKERYKPHVLETVLRAAVAERLAQGKIEPWLAIAWINLQFPEDNAEQVKLMQALFKSPAWVGMPFEVKFAAREWFGKNTMTPGQIAWLDAGNPEIVCKDLLSLTNTTDAATTAAALDKAIAGVKKSPVKIDIMWLDQLAVVTNTVFADPKVRGLVLDVADGLRYTGTRESQPFVDSLLAYVEKNPDPVNLQRASACIWSYAVRAPYGRQYQQMKKITESLLEQHPSACYSLARTGVEALNRSRGAYGFNAVASIPEMKALVGRSAMKLGLADMPVAQTDPAYPVYKSQADWLSGNEESAWAMLNASWDQLLLVHRGLSIDYLMWALQRAIYSRDSERQESLVKALLAWAGEQNTPLNPAERARLEIAYGDIAVQRGLLKEARELFIRTAQNKAYDGLPEHGESVLRRVAVERMEKDFDGALQTLSELEMEHIPEMWAPVRYARAEVFYDMEEYNDAADEIDSILARLPGHAEAKIMQGKLQIKRQKLMEATEVELGTVSSRDALVPGGKLKVTLSDPTLDVSGAGVEVEVEVWSTSGDRESFFLRQFGDQKTKFRGEVETALGVTNSGDRILQVIGDDEIFYAYSDRFRKKMNNLEEKRGGPITVASDALLMASARKLLSEAEQLVADMQAQMEAIEKGPVTAAAKAAAQAKAAAEAEQNAMAGISQAEAEERRLKELQNKLLSERIKPGNPIHVRVIDPDRSRTAQIDEVAVSVESSSGDSIGRVVIKETGPYTGWFEGSIPTRGAQAMAFADNTEPGRNPNMVISPRPDYPAWRPVAVKDRVPVFRIDLNDNIEIGEMTITAREPGARLKKFILQTGMNPREMTTVAAYPTNQISLESPWQPSVTIMNDTDRYHVSNERSVYDLSEIEHHMERGWFTQQYSAGVSENVTGPSAALTNSIPGKVQWRRQNQQHNAHVIYRFRGYFFEPEAVKRRFKVELGEWKPPEVHSSVADPAQYLLAVDGRIITSKEKPAVLEGEIDLRQGLHRFEIWATGWDCRIGFGRSVKVLANLGPATVAGTDGTLSREMAECPDSFFDADKFPKGLLTHKNGRATIEAGGDGTELKVKFAPGSRARLFNIVLAEQEGPVPVLNRISLSDAAGKQILPVPADFAELNKNNTLEILTGDKVAVRYVDDRFVSSEKEKQERFLNVSFSDADISFVFFEMRKDWVGNDQEYYDRLLRFEKGSPITLKVDDPDMDVSENPDTVKVVLESKSGGKQEFVLPETGPSTGVFRLSVMPVTEVPQAGQVKVGEGESLTAVYRDEENINPGVPADRYASVKYAVYRVPKLYLSHATVSPIDFKALEFPPGLQSLNIGFERTGISYGREEVAEGLLSVEQKKRATGGMVRPRWQINNAMMDVSDSPSNGFENVSGRIVCFQVEAPHLALRSSSQAEVYVQTDEGRKRAKAAQAPGGEPSVPVFDTSVPGTMRLVGGLTSLSIGSDHSWRETPKVPIYIGGGIRMDSSAGDSMFLCSVPLIAGVLPDHGVLTDEEYAARLKAGIAADPPGLVVRPGERVYVGFRYTDKTGAEQWLTASTKVITHPVLDVMEEDYRMAKTNAYVGENLFLRVVDLGADVSDGSDAVRVTVQAKSGAKHQIELLEVDTHSGVFRGICPLSYSTAVTNAETYDVKVSGFPVVYDDKVGARYTDAGSVQTETHLVYICKGGDGMIVPFSKKYDDPIIATRTQFTLAESYLETAKHHRTLGEDEVAEREYDRAKQMLAGAIDQFRDPETRAHAEYLLGNLTQEEADATKDKELQKERYRAALSRFMNVTGNYSGTLYASKAQFKIATVFEKLGEPDIAAQEYVKLAYKYPESEFLAVAMARLGTHFLRKAAEYEKQAGELLAKTDNKDAQFEGAAMQKMAVREYLKSANIFGRLQERFPDHELAGQGGLRAGQAYMRAGGDRKALAAFLRVANKDTYDGPEVRAQAMYWAGMCYEKINEAMAAYSMYKRLTFDFPESKWASYARSQLSQEKLLNLETDIETRRVEEGR